LDAPGCDAYSYGWTDLGEISITGFTPEQTPFLSLTSDRRLSVVSPTPSGFSFGHLLGPRRLGTSITLVEVVFGLRAPSSSPMVGAPEWRWKFDPTFEPANPWAQRAMYVMCKDAALLKELYLDSTKCWISEFRDYANGLAGERFPSRNFDQIAVSWYAQASEERKVQLWREGGKMKACQLQFYVRLSAGATSSSILKYKKVWDEYLSSHNAAASLTANRAWHTAHKWVAAEAQDAILNSTAITIAIEILIGFLCILGFTGDPGLALIVLSLVIINISGLAFVMACILRWSFGPIEVICLVVFVGYSVTFGLHVANNYAQAGPADPAFFENYELSKQLASYGCRAWQMRSRSPASKAGEESATLEDEVHNTVTKAMTMSQDVESSAPQLSKKDIRLARTHTAVLHVGGAILSAAVSTVGSSIFLFLCTLTIFNKIGLVVITVTIMSVVVTLVALPAVLIKVGPGLDPCYKRIPRECFLRIVRGKGLGRAKGVYNL